MIEMLYKRRSIRKYKETSIETEKIDKIIEAALLAPSSRGKRPWEFIIIDNKALILQLSESKIHGSQFLKTAPLIILIIADENISDVWIEDCSIAATLIQLEAETLNLGTCWVQIRNREYSKTISSENYIKTLLALPKDIRVASIIGIGYPDEEKNPYIKSDLLHNKVHYNSY